MKRYIFSLVLLLVLSLCALAEDVVILYDNDVHCAINGYAEMGGLRDEMRKTHRYVTTVSCGDFVQGDIIGNQTKGEAIIDLMNSVGYDVVVPGNHEFDYGIQQLQSIVSRLHAQTICCNLLRLSDGTPLFHSSVTIDYGERRVAFIGITTPSTLTSSVPTTFTDSAGLIAYTFCWDNLSVRLQYVVDSLRNSGVDYVVLLSHIGESPDAKGVDIVSIAAATSGIDVILDGHSHSVIPMRIIKNSNHEDVVLSQTGTRFANIGRLTISDDGTIRTELLPLSSVRCTKRETSAMINRLNKSISRMTNRVVGTTCCNLFTYKPNGDYAVRTEESNLGDLVADAYRAISGANIAFVHGGSIRTDIMAGYITYGQLLSALPFDNVVMTAYATGETILDILESSVSLLPAESGSFLQVSGITFDVDTTLPSPVRYDKEEFVAGIVGKRRVSNVRIWNPDSLSFESIVPRHVYTIASNDYALVNRGCDGAFAACTLCGKTFGTVLQAVESYIKQNLGGRVSDEYRTPAHRINI